MTSRFIFYKEDEEKNKENNQWVRLSLTRGNCSKRRTSLCKLDKELTRRVSKEARLLAKVCAEISSRTGIIEHPQWHRPDRTVSMSSTLDALDKEVHRSYLPAMEHTFDLLNVFMQLLVNYLNQIPVVDEYFKSASAVRPTNPSMGIRTLAYMLWSRIKFISELINKVENAENTYEVGSANAVVQTEVVSLTTCESCHTSKNMIKKLVDTVEDVCKKYDYKNSNVLEVKKEMATDVFYISHWAAVSKWCDAIGKDFQLLTDITYESIKNSTTLRNENVYLQEQITGYEKIEQLLQKQISKDKINHEKEIDDKKVECKILLDKLDENEKLISELRKGFEEERNKYFEVKEKYTSANRELKTKKQKIESLEYELAKVKEECDKNMFDLKDKIDMKDITMLSLNKKTEELEEKLKISEKELSLLKTKFEKQQQYEAELWKNNKKLQEENQALRESIDLNSEEMYNMVLRMQEIKGHVSFNSLLRATGNPLRDMESQKIINEAKIITLEEENQDLTNLIIKLHTKKAALLSLLSTENITEISECR